MERGDTFRQTREAEPSLYWNFKIITKVGTLAYQFELPDQLSQVHSTFHVSNMEKCLVDEPLAIPLDEIPIDDKLNFIEELVKTMDQEVKRLKQSRIPIVKVRWNSRRGPDEEFPNLSTNFYDELNKEFVESFESPSTSSGSACSVLDIEEDADEEYLLEEQFRIKLEAEEILLFKEEQKLEEESRLRLEEEAKMMREEEKTGVTSSSWLKVYNKLKHKPVGRCVINQDMTEYLKYVKPWSEDLSRCNTSIDNVWLTEDLDLYLGKPGMLRCRFPWCKDRMVDRQFWECLVCLDPPRKGWLLDDHIDIWVEYMWHVRPKSANWAMVSSYFVQLLLQNSMPIWYANGETYNLPWSAVEQNLVTFDICSGLVTFYDSGDTYAIECRDWMSDNIPLEIQYEVMLRLPVKSLLHFRIVSKTWKSIIDSNDFVVAYGACNSQPASFLVTYDQGFVNSNYIRFIDVPFRFTRYHHFRPSLPDLNLNNKAIGSCYGLWCFSSSRLASIWNPCIRKSVGVVIPYWVSNTDLEEKIVFGFGVHPVTFDPTLVKIAYPERDHGRWSVVVFRLSTQRWVILPPNNVPGDTSRLKRWSHACIGTSIYWVASERVLNFEGVTVKNT
ncbi:F-box domain containing protein [Tanacetum coccineum]